MLRSPARSTFVLPLFVIILGYVESVLSCVYNTYCIFITNGEQSYVIFIKRYVWTFVFLFDIKKRCIKPTLISLTFFFATVRLLRSAPSCLNSFWFFFYLPPLSSRTPRGPVSLTVWQSSVWRLARKLFFSRTVESSWFREGPSFLFCFCMPSIWSSCVLPSVQQLYARN